MFHVDNPTTVKTKPAIKKLYDKTVQWFGDSSLTQVPTAPTADWFNMIQAELLDVLYAAGITPDKATQTQLTAAIKKLITIKANEYVLKTGDEITGTLTTKALIDKATNIGKTGTIAWININTDEDIYKLPAGYRGIVNISNHPILKTLLAGWGFIHKIGNRDASTGLWVEIHSNANDGNIFKGYRLATGAITWQEFITTANIYKYISTKIGMINLFPFRKDELPAGWVFANGDNYALTSARGKALNGLSTNYKADWGVKVTGQNINVPSLFYVDGRGVYLRAVDGTTRQVGSIQLDALRKHKHISAWGDDAYNPNGFGVTKSKGYFGSHSADWGNYSYFTSDGTNAPDYPTLNDEGVIDDTETRVLNIGMTPAVYLGV